MKTTLDIDETILARAAALTGIKEKSRLVRLGLESLISVESAKRQALLGGEEDAVLPVRRRRSSAE
jgi:hypothetical protein